MDELDRYYDLCAQAYNGRVVLTHFLNLQQQNTLNKIVHKQGLNIVYDGGYNDALLKRALISFEKVIKFDFQITKLKVVYNRKFAKLSHRDYLGVLMSLQIKREFIGDIIIGDDDVVILDSRIAKAVINDVEKIGKISVKFQEYDGDIERVENLKEKVLIVSSIRLDSLVSQVFKLSRSKAKDAIIEGLVKVDYNVVENPTMIVSNTVEISLRKFGKAKISIREQKTTKEKYVLDVGYYI